MFIYKFIIVAIIHVVVAVAEDTPVWRITTCSGYIFLQHLVSVLLTFGGIYRTDSSGFLSVLSSTLKTAYCVTLIIIIIIIINNELD